MQQFKDANVTLHCSERPSLKLEFGLNKISLIEKCDFKIYIHINSEREYKVECYGSETTQFRLKSQEGNFLSYNRTKFSFHDKKELRFASNQGREGYFLFQVIKANRDVKVSNNWESCYYARKKGAPVKRNEVQKVKSEEDEKKQEEFCLSDTESMRKLLFSSDDESDGQQNQAASRERKIKIKHLIQVKKQNEESKNICMICMESKDLQAHPDCCQHYFCLSCLRIWSQQMNLCPMCRKEFKFVINKKLNLKYEVEPPKIQEQPSEEEEEEGDDQICYICGNGGREETLLICDNCEINLAHTYCLGLAFIPVEDWYCEVCEDILRDQESYLQEIEDSEEISEDDELVYFS